MEARRTPAIPRRMMFLAGLLIVIISPLFPLSADAQTRLIMMPPQAPSPAPDIYNWGDRLIISFRLAGNPENYSVGVAFGNDTYGHMKSPSSEENIVTYELQLDAESARDAFDQFNQGKPYAYARAIIRRGSEDLVEKAFWVMNPARRWPDALRLLEPVSGETREVRIGVTLPEDRVNATYYLDLVRLPMLLPGGTRTTAVPRGRPIAISDDQQEYAIPVEPVPGVYEVRLRGPGEFVHDVRRFQLPEHLPDITLSDQGIVTEDFGDDFIMEFQQVGVEVSNFPADNDPELLIRPARPVQIAGNYRSVRGGGRAENWSTEFRLDGPGAIAVTTAYLDDEIVLGTFPGGDAAAEAFAQNKVVKLWSSENRIHSPGSTFSIEINEYQFLDRDHVWVFVRENMSGRRPQRTPSSFSDRIIKRWKVDKGSRRLQITAPVVPGEYRIDLELPDREHDGPEGIVSDTHVFSVVAGQDEVKIGMDTEAFIMGEAVFFSVDLDPRSYAAPVTVEAVRPEGISSTGAKYASRTPPIVFKDGYRRILWSYEDSNAIYPESLHDVGWSTWLWSPGRYEARVIIGVEGTDQARILAQKQFDLVVPEAPATITSIEADPENDRYLHVALSLPEWITSKQRYLTGWEHGVHVAVVRPRTRTLGNALRFEKILSSEQVESFQINDEGKAIIRVEKPYFEGDMEAWLLLDVFCFAQTCPTAIIDRKAFLSVPNPESVLPVPEHIAEHLIFPADESINRPGRAFPDLRPAPDGH